MPECVKLQLPSDWAPSSLLRCPPDLSDVCSSLSLFIKLFLNIHLKKKKKEDRKQEKRTSLTDAKEIPSKLDSWKIAHYLRKGLFVVLVQQYFPTNR